MREDSRVSTRHRIRLRAPSLCFTTIHEVGSFNRDEGKYRDG